MRGSTFHRRQSARRRMAVNLTPLMDVMFLLLIYFVVTAGYSSPQASLPAVLQPDDKPGSGRQALELPHLPVVVTVRMDKDGQPRWGVADAAGLHQFDHVAGLTALLESWLVQPGGVGGIYDPDHPVVLDVTGPIRWQDVAATFDAVQRAGYQQVQLPAGDALP